MASSGPAPAWASRHTSARHRLSAPEDDPDAFVRGLRDISVQGGYEVIIPSTDPEVVTLSARRDEVPAVVPYPPHETVMRALDKLKLYWAATVAGVSSPATHDPQVDIKHTWREPMMVKARLHADGGGGAGHGPVAVQEALRPSDMTAQAANMREIGAEPLLQKRVEGELIAMTVVADHGGRIVAAVQQQATRLSAKHGNSARAHTVPVDRKLKRAVSNLMSELGWYGMAQLQFQNADAPELIDFNPRLYGSASLALRAGANLPGAWAALATGRPLPPMPREARVGLRYHWLEGDVRRALHSRNAEAGREVAGSLRYAVGATHGVWALEDPAPAAAVMADAAVRASRRLTRRVGSAS